MHQTATRHGRNIGAFPFLLCLLQDCDVMCFFVSLSAAFPLIFIKPFQRGLSKDKSGPETVPEADSDFEDINSEEKQPVGVICFWSIRNKSHTYCTYFHMHWFSQNSDCSSNALSGTKNPSDGNERSEERSADIKVSTPKKRLLLSCSEKEKLLDWEMEVSPEEPPNNTKTSHQLKEQVETFIYENNTSFLLLL